MNFNELAASFGKLSRGLDGVVTKAEIETSACKALWWDKDNYNVNSFILLPRNGSFLQSTVRHGTP